ncbi:hypothetical protein BSL82_03515 [Tardibacter chloracetimidivorans]|uniref:Uncharacterized protein n=1 Tax=Tardibacter chloracetimidivorans TaxID=1921510 RepID=A0A1L3ZS79_9SPHN|nr:hypothetical protein [Tardibacter chloracetimidivorans]API58486.1 hypothetical protein BSL82_03515 [Tardibacter chloracetimidivorans]
MSEIKSFFRTLYERIVSWFRESLSIFRKDLSGALAAFDKASRKLDQFLVDSHENLKKLAAIRESVQREIEARNSEIDRAYRISHRLNELTK